MSRKSLKPGVLTAPLPPVLVTVGEGEGANIITIGWTGILSTHPPRTYVSVRPERHSYGLLRRHGEFVINLATVSMARRVDYCGIYTGARVDKFKECGFTRVASKEVSVPSIAECPLSIECRVVEVIPMGTHDVFVADVVGVSCDESMLDADGRLCFDRADLLAYAHGEYFALGEKVGSFGFSTKKSASKKNATRNASASGGVKKPARAVGSESSSKGSISSEGADAKATAGSKRAGGNSGKSERSATGTDGHRPFYLDAPRGKNKRKGKKR